MFELLRLKHLYLYLFYSSSTSLTSTYPYRRSVSGLRRRCLVLLPRALGAATALRSARRSCAARRARISGSLCTPRSGSSLGCARKFGSPCTPCSTPVRACGDKSTTLRTPCTGTPSCRVDRSKPRRTPCTGTVSGCACTRSSRRNHGIYSSAGRARICPCLRTRGSSTRSTAGRARRTAFSLTVCRSCPPCRTSRRAPGRPWLWERRWTGPRDRRASPTEDRSHFAVPHPPRARLTPPRLKVGCLLVGVSASIQAQPPRARRRVRRPSPSRTRRCQCPVVNRHAD